MELFGAFDERGPLAYRMCPRDLDEFVGQEHILGEGKPLRRLIESGKLSASIFFGPPGTGKTALARIIAKRFNTPFYQINASEAKPSDLQGVLRNIKRGGGVLFVDEIHRFNRLQQEVLLPHLERGGFIFLGSTVQNPYFAISKAILSRTLVFEFKPLSEDEILRILKRAVEDERGLGDYDVQVEDGVLERIAVICEGDARRALNILEALFYSEGGERGTKLSLKTLELLVERKTFVFSKDGDEHYDLISALIKSIRGSDPDASIYWLVRLLEAGEDPLYILRRIIVHSAEDIGLADPNALDVAVNAFKGFELVGRPEGDLLLALAVLYLATAPKSNTVLRALENARKLVREKRGYEVPAHLRDSHFRGAKKLGRGVGYKYPHSEDDSGQKYMPTELDGEVIFKPMPVGYEKEILRRHFLKRREVKKK